MGRGRKLIFVMVIFAAVLLTVFAALLISSNSLGNALGINVALDAMKEKEDTTSAETSIVTSTQLQEPTVSETEKAAETSSPVEATESGEDAEADENNKEPEKERVKVKAVYLTGVSAGTKTLDKYIDIINKTELNAVVIDIKDNGLVNYKSSVPAVVDNKLYVNYFNPEKVIKKLHENNIYVIARLVCFRDDGYAMKNPDLAIKRPDGSIWKENKKNNTGAWTNPYKEEVLRYNLDIAKEAISLGFDEIQFDYVRFPTAKKGEVSYGDNMPTKVDAICNFLKLAAQEIHSAGVPVSADVFGIIAESKSDGEALGQDLERVGMDIDAISPMVYPSHYANGQEVNGVKFAKPDLEPYEVVYQTLLKTKDRLSKLPEYKATVRPYLQDFTATWIGKGNYQEYGAGQVRQQIKAVYDAGYEEWILWDAKNTYSIEAFQEE